jgi:hypothetical protein
MMIKGIWSDSLSQSNRKNQACMNGFCEGHSPGICIYTRLDSDDDIAFLSVEF